jgi:pimeloyl-ACP methyl ester carboxylesterase
MATGGVDCQPTVFAVERRLAGTTQGPSAYTLRGTLCRPVGAGRPRAAVLLWHGSAYRKTYWDPPGVDPGRYSPLRLLAGAGYLTVAVDRLGSGQSDRPPSEEVTADASAAALHDVVSRLRGDPAMRTGSGKVFVVGHSSGSTLAIREAAAHHDVDGLVITGLLHTPGSGSDLFLAMLHPASKDPRTKDDPTIPAGYKTTTPGSKVLWHYGPNADEALLRLDEERLTDATPIHAGGFADEVFVGPPRSLEVDVPVLVVVGDRDLSHCTPPTCPQAAAEASFYPKSPDFGIIVRPRVAHALNLHLDANMTTALIRTWLDHHSAEVAA